MTAVYVRVSTQRQAQAQTIEQQLERLRAHLRDQGVELASEKVFRDDGYSGATLNRPGLDRLRDAVRAGEVDRLLVTDPDRLARNYVQLMVLLEELERAGCEVAFLDRPMSREPQDQLLLQIRGAVAEYERTLIAERMRRGRQAKLRAGCLLPWTRPPYGYRLDPDRPRDPAGVTLEAAEAAVVRELFAAYLEDNASLFGLAKRLRALGIASPNGRPGWSPATLRGLLTNPTYTGQVYAGRWRSRAPRLRRSATHPIGKPSDSSVPVPAAEWLPVASVPALVSGEEFARVQAKLARNRAFARRHNTRHAYLLRALVSCGVCRSSCLCRTVHPRYGYYVCGGKADPVHSGRDEPCPARYAPAHRLDDLVWRDLCELLTEPGSIAQALARAHGGGWLPQELQARREQLRRGRLALERQLERLTEAYLLAAIPLPEYQRRRQALEQRLEALGRQADQLEAQVDRRAELAGWAASAADFCRRVRAGLAGADLARKRQLVELLVDRVLVADGEVEIRYAIPLSPASERVPFCHLRKDYLDLPPQGVPAQLLDRRPVRGDRQVGDELPVDAGPVGGLVRLAGVQDRQGEGGVALPLADRRQDAQATVGELHRRGLDGALVVADLDAVPSLDRHLAHGVRDRARPVSREALDATPDQEVRPELPGQAEQLVDVALAVADVDASFRLAEQ
jgi:site-specific DNA recombinase